ncbi:hypothetical protein ACKWTF_016633 [Chironomus riparius]
MSIVDKKLSKSLLFKMSNPKYDNRKYPCTVCHKRFKAKNHLAEHMPLHSDKTNYKCEKCQMEFKAPGTWRSHMRKAHGFECPHCSKPFTTLTLLKQHRMKKHSDFMRQKLEDEVGMIEKPSNRNGLEGNKNQSGQQKLINLPTKKITNSAPISIVKKIIAKSRLNVNSNAHSATNGKFVCKVCGHRYAIARSLQRHMTTAHKDPFKFKCTRCDYTTNRSDNFKMHNQRHEIGKSLKCSVPSCKFEFFCLKNLRIHIQKVHNNEEKSSIETFIKKEETDDYLDADLNEEEVELMEELDPGLDDENGDIEENVDDSFKFQNKSFLNSTEKSTQHGSFQASQPIKKLTQLKISTSFSLNSKKKEEDSTEIKATKPKSTSSSVSYECCECKIDFPDNTELWDHLLAIHYHKMKNNVKKT